ncbi:hypothetical protein ACA106_06265 [Agrobacterium pusense]|uniref:Uncharacterized protein n=1 Tax=Agrobacterium pusense TaxID=648995 RepID=U4QF16_9HYPH|nr:MULTISPECIES: hypothetical protein [Agrobacterium]CDI12155.1 conserved protein of unknown function [Agrobacterium pusense]
MQEKKSNSDFWYYLVVGSGNVNQGLARIMGAILAIIVCLGTLFWSIWPV